MRVSWSNWQRRFSTMDCELGKLVEPENKSAREVCERARSFLKWDDLPSLVEQRSDEVAVVWWTYKDTWLGDPQEPNFKFSLAIPAYATWGKKKRDKYLLAHRPREIADRLTRALNANEPSKVPLL
jgi:hypothetical protein